MITKLTWALFYGIIINCGAHIFFTAHKIPLHYLSDLEDGLSTYSAQVQGPQLFLLLPDYSLSFTTTNQQLFEVAHPLEFA